MTPTFGAAVVPSRIVLGTAAFGSEISKEKSFAVLDAYADAGGNFLDTAHIYAAWIPGGWGASERTVGEWLHAHGARGNVVLGTKGAHPPLDDMAHSRSSEADIRQDLDESLARLGVDAIDIYWLHRDDPARPVADILETLDGLVREGRIRTYGASNWTRERLDEANACARERGLTPFVANQPGWSLADRPGPSPVGGMLYLDETFRQWHVKTGLPVVAYSAQARGYFGKANSDWAKNGFTGPAPCGADYDSPENRRRLEQAIKLAAEKDCTPNQIALAYLLHQPFPVYPIIGSSNPEHVREAMAALSIRLSAEECATLEQ